LGNEALCQAIDVAWIFAFRLGCVDHWLRWCPEFSYHHCTAISHWSLRSWILSWSVVMLSAFSLLTQAGIVYFITIWYPWNKRAVRIACVVAFCNLAGAFGGSIAFGVGHINGAAGLEGFRWLFIIEGIITLLSAFLLWFFLPDYPTRARWLNESDKKFAIDRLKERGGGYNREHGTKAEIWAAINPRMMVHYLAYVSISVLRRSLH
jgi:MFS family permease